MAKKLSVLLSVICIILLFVSCGKPNEPEIMDPTENEVTSQNNTEAADDMQVKYDSGALFKFGLLPAKSVDGKWGFINPKGEWVISPQYKRVISDGFCANGYAVVNINGVRQVIDLTGNVIEIPGLTEISTNNFSKDGIASVYIENYNEPVYLTIKDGEAVLHTSVKYNGDFTDDGLAVLDNGDGSSVINSDFEYVLEFQKDWKIRDYSNGYAVATIYDENNKITKIGYLNTKGEWAIELSVKYEPQRFNRAGIAAVRVENPGYKENAALYHLINTSGEKICEFKAVEVDYCKNSDWLRYKSTENKSTATYTYGFINAQGEQNKVMLSRRSTIDFLGSVANGRIVDEHEIYDENGNLLFEAENYVLRSDFYTDGYAIAETLGRKIAVINLNGDIVFKSDDQNLITEIEAY